MVHYDITMLVCFQAAGVQNRFLFVKDDLKNILKVANKI